MSATTNILGLSPTTTNLTSPAAFIAGNWAFAYLVLASRTPKQFLGLDHNVSPRQDLNKYGADAVRSGKITQAQLDQLQRLEAASANSTEGFILFTASVLFAVVAGVPEPLLTNACTTYTVARMVYGAAYVFTSTSGWSQVRGVAWWVGNASCLYLLWKGATLNRL